MAENHKAEFDRVQREFERSAAEFQVFLYGNLSRADDETEGDPEAAECVRSFYQSLDNSLEHLGAVLSDPAERRRISACVRSLYEDDCYSAGVDSVNEAADFLKNARVLLGLDRSAGEQAFIREGEREFDRKFDFFHLEEKRQCLGEKLKTLISGLTGEQQQCFLKQLKYPAQAIEPCEISSPSLLLKSLAGAELKVLYLYYAVYTAVKQNFDLGCYSIGKLSADGVLAYQHIAAGGGGFAPAFTVQITDDLRCEIHAVNKQPCRTFAQAIQLSAEHYSASLVTGNKQEEGGNHEKEA